MRTNFVLTCESRSVGSIDISDPETAINDMLRTSSRIDGLVALGDSRSYITARNGVVCTVVFYDCFWLPPEDREYDYLRALLNELCEVAATHAKVVCRTLAEYNVAMNTLALFRANTPLD